MSAFGGKAGSAAAIWPLAARAQQGERVRHIGVLMSLAADDKEGQARLAAFLQGLQELGWIDGRNVRVDTRWGAGDGERARKYIAKLNADAGRHLGLRRLSRSTSTSSDTHRADCVHADPCR
jgi:hypothetical protein